MSQPIPIYSKNAPKPVGPYSQAIMVGELVYCSGQIGIDQETGGLEEGVEAQTEACLKNLASILEEAGTSLDLAIRCTIYLTEIGDFERMNSVYTRFFKRGCPPSRVTVGVASLPKGAKVEIDAIAISGRS